MPKPSNIVTRRSIMKQFDLDGEILDRLEEMEIVFPITRPGKERAYTWEDVDRIRVFRLLVEELEVNQAGAEIILRMRNQIFQLGQRLSRLFNEANSQGLLKDLLEIMTSIEEEPW